MKKILFIICVSIATLFAEFDKVGTSSGQFLKLTVGAKANAMAGAVVAHIDDGSSGYWNPAGFASFKSNSMTVAHNPWVLDINEDYLAYAFPVKQNSVIAISLLSLTMGEQDVTTNEYQDGNGSTYSVMDYAFGISYSQRLSDHLNYGITFKYISLNAYNESAHSFAVDVGSILNTHINGLSIGMALNNFGGDLKYEGSDLLASVDPYINIGGNYESNAYIATQKWPLPLVVKIGLAWQVLGTENQYPFIESSKQSLIFEVDAIHPNDSSERLAFGGEYGFKDMAFFRSGYLINYDLEKGMTVGAGVKIPLGDRGNLLVDYSYTPLNYFGNNSQFSLEYVF
ncbi:PorV/PorQ family protein [bacterium]|nr:PorV/PorQ family protein [bacterium]